MKNILNTENYLDDTYFRKAITEKLEEIKEYRQSIIDRTTQFNYDHVITSEIKLKRNPYVYLEERNMLNVDTMLLECKKILEKKSELPSSVRSYLGDIFSYAMGKAIIKHSEHDKKKFKKDQ